MAEIEKNQLEVPSATDNSPTEVNAVVPTKFEQERYTRRQALRKFGFGAGLSAFMLLSADDLARMVGRELQKRAGDNQVANQIAKEFQSAGVAMAITNLSSPSPCTGWENPPHILSQCSGCNSGPVMDRCKTIPGANCDLWESECGKFCGETGGWTDWYNCWNHYNTNLP